MRGPRTPSVMTSRMLYMSRLLPCTSLRARITEHCRVSLMLAHLSAPLIADQSCSSLWDRVAASFHSRLRQSFLLLMRKYRLKSR
jgi:hypothetical protein